MLVKSFDGFLDGLEHRLNVLLVQLNVRGCSFPMLFDDVVCGPDELCRSVLEGVRRQRLEFSGQNLSRLGDELVQFSDLFVLGLDYLSLSLSFLRNHVCCTPIGGFSIFESLRFLTFNI